MSDKTANDGFSSMPHNKESCEALALQVTEFWDTQMLADFAVSVLAERYLKNKKLFVLAAKHEDEQMNEEG